MFGYEDHELPNRPSAWQDLIFPEDLAKVDQAFAAQGGAGVTLIFRELNYDNRLF